jgi:RNA polymerase sigma-70 factor (ECF subfamily)
MNGMREADSENAKQGLFPQTHWSDVLAASRRGSAASDAALEAICRAYWHPLYAYARHCGQAPHDAQDLTQGFFALLLRHRWLEMADREKGRLRTFLIVSFKNFMNKEWRKASAQKRGGGQTPVPLDTELAESRLDISTRHPEEVFDRQWALTLLELTLQRLNAELAASGRPTDFDSLKGTLTAAHGTIDYESVAAKLGLSAGAARVAVHRLRRRFRAVYREEIARTLGPGTDVEEEMRHLAAALALSAE